MHHKKNHMIKRLLMSFILALFCLYSGIRMQAYYAEEEPVETEETEEKQLVITVVEEMEAEDIEEDEIPLAAFPTANQQYGRRHAILAGTVFAMTCCYALYFILYEKKLLRLKREAAELEYKRMNERKAQL